MSMTLMAKAMSIKVGSHLRKLVLIKLADNANDKGECWPSYQHVADQCECSKSAVKSHISALVALGLLVKENRLGVNNGKGNTSNLYYLTFYSAMSPESTAPVTLTHPGMAAHYSAGAQPDSSPVAADDSRSSHSPEPVKDPVNTLKKKAFNAESAPDETSKKRSTAMPANFKPSSKHQTLAIELAVDLAAEFAIFGDYHQAKGSRFKDWNAALNTWLRNAAKFNSHKNQRIAPFRVINQASGEIPTGFNQHLPTPPQGEEDDELI